MTMRRPCGGFSLLEILVAFVVLALALGVLMRVFSGALNNAFDSERYAAATLVAESRLASVGVDSPLMEGELSGASEAGFRWVTRVTRMSDDRVVAEASQSVDLFRVEVTVSWDFAQGKTKHIRLVSLRTGLPL